MRRTLPVLFIGSALMFGCEDGPDQLFTPFEGDPAPQNGYEPEAGPWTQAGDKGFTSQGGDSVGRAKFCDEDIRTNVIQEMIVQPIIPDVSVGGVPLWGEGDTPLPADDLLGHPDDGKFCDPTGVYADAFTWGPTDELIVWFDIETRLVTGLMAYQSYLGKMNASYTNEDGTTGTLEIKTREHILLDGVELDRYAGRGTAPDDANAWMNPANASKIYRAVRETFFDAEPFPDDYDCFAAQTCNLIYTTSNDATPQDTFIWFPDSGWQIRLTPEGTVIFVYIEPVRSAPFESGGTFAFAPDGTNVAVTYDSDLRQGCTLDLTADMTWADFKNNCIASGDERVINRANYNVDDARDAVSVELTTMYLDFLRPTATKPVFRDGEQPLDTDILYGLSFSRSNAAVVEEFRPRTLAMGFASRLQSRMREAIVATGTTTEVTSHPYYNYTISTASFTDDTAQRIGQLVDANGVNFVPETVAGVLAVYNGLTEEQRDMLDPRARDELYYLEAYTLALLDAFTHGGTNNPETFIALYSTDDRRWSIGTAHFLVNNVPVRVQAQYSLDYGGLSFVTTDRGYSDTDALINLALEQSGSPNAFFEFGDVLREGHLLSLGSDGITVTDYDRQLATLTLRYSRGGVGSNRTLTVSGDPIQDLNGYTKQIRGERFEFVPANVVRLYGKESVVLGYIDGNGVLSRVNMGTFKGTLPLCSGLNIAYGDNVREKLAAWERTVSTAQYRDCEIVFNYSENGNVLLSVTSLANQRQVIVVNNRAVTASAWQ